MHTVPDASGHVLLVVDAIVTIDYMINSSHENRRVAKTWEETIKSVRGYPTPEPVLSAKQSDENATEGTVFCVTEQRYVTWSNKRPPKAIAATSSAATPAPVPPRWTHEGSDLEIARFYGGLYDEIAQNAVFAHEAYPGPVRVGTIGSGTPWFVPRVARESGRSGNAPVERRAACMVM
jgi:hypothetical protein